MPRKYAIGRRAWFICGRCGQRGLYRDSVFDGYYPNVRVHPECFEDRHPQEKLVKVDDPIALWRPSPDPFGLQTDISTPVLAGSYSFTTGDYTLTWSESIASYALVDQYHIYRREISVDPTTEFELLATFDVVRDWETTRLNDLEYIDTTVSIGFTYEYYVVGHPVEGPDSLNSNVVTLNIVVPVGLNVPLVYDETDSGGLVTLTRSGGKAITPDGFVCNGFDNRLSTAAIPANLQSATAELALQVTMYHFGGQSRATNRELVLGLCLNDANSTPKVEIFVDEDPSDVSDPRAGLAVHTGGSTTQFRLNRARWQFQWRRHEITSGGQQAYMQGVEYNPTNGRMLYSVHFNETLARVYEVDIPTGEVTRTFDFPAPYKHVGVIARRSNGDWWFGDASVAGKFCRVDIETSFTIGTAQILQEVTVSSSLSTGFGGASLAFATISGTEYAMVGTYGTSGTQYMYFYLASLLAAGTGLTVANRFKRFTHGLRNQGVTAGPENTHCYASYGTGTYSAGRIIRVDLTLLIAQGDGTSFLTNEDTVRYITPPSNFPEDLAFDGDGWLWCPTESDVTFEDDMNWNCLWRTMRYESSSNPSWTYIPGFPKNTYTANYNGAGTWNVYMNGRIFRTFTAVPDVTPTAFTIGGPIQAAAGGTNGFFRGVISGVHLGAHQITTDQMSLFASGGFETRDLVVLSFPAFNFSALGPSVAGWTNESGAIAATSTTGIGASYDPGQPDWFFGGVVALTVSRVRFATNTLTKSTGGTVSNSEMDTKLPWFVNNFRVASFTAHADNGSLGFRFLDSTPTQIRLDQGELYSPLPDLYWKYRSNTPGNAPILTRNIDLVYRAERFAGTNNDAHMDHIRVYGFMEP